MIISSHQSRNCTSAKKSLASLTGRWKNFIYSLEEKKDLTYHQGFQWCWFKSVSFLIHITHFEITSFMSMTFLILIWIYTHAVHKSINIFLNFTYPYWYGGRGNLPSQLGLCVTDSRFFGSRGSVGAPSYWRNAVWIIKESSWGPVVLTAKARKMTKNSWFLVLLCKRKGFKFLFRIFPPFSFLDKKVTFLDKNGALDWLKWYTTSYKIGPNVYISFYSNYKMLS